MSYTAIDLSKEERIALRANWAELFHSKSLVSSDFVLYAFLRGKDPLSGFTPVRNTRKLANGQLPYGQYHHALSVLSKLYIRPLLTRLESLFPGISEERARLLIEQINECASQAGQGGCY